MNDRVVYQKHDSFVGIRHRQPLPDVMARIRRVEENLSRTALPEEAKALVKTACDELTGVAAPPGDHPPFTLHTYVIDEINRLTDADLPRYMYYRYRYEVFPQRHILDSFPPCLQIEPTSVCNYRCVFCYQTDRSFTRKRSGYMGMMSLDLFKRLVDETEGQCEAVTLASRGEPLICPDIKEMLAYAKGRFLGLKLNTNAWFLDEEMCHAILQSEMNTLVFSVDAASEPTYSRFRVGGRLDRVVENIRRFHDIRMKHYPRSRTITRISGVKVPGTPDLAAMEAFWGELVDQVAFVKYNPWENTYERPVNDVTAPCSDLWRRMLVWWDGTVNPCDVDYKSTLAVGNVKDKPLGGLWRSEPYEKLRQDHLLARRGCRTPCASCVVV